MFFVCLRRAGPEWDPALALEEQSGWDAHAAFMDGLVERGVVVLGGPLADEFRVVLAIEAGSEAEVRETLAADPWHGTHLVVASVDAWTIRLDGRAR
jgi:YCII-related domain